MNMEGDLSVLLCESYREFQEFQKVQSAVLLRMNSLTLDTFSVRPGLYIKGVTPSDTVKVIPANPLADRPRGNQYVATKMNIRPEEHDDLRYLPFDERSGKVLSLHNLDSFYARTPFNEFSHSEMIISNLQLSDFLMLDLLRQAPNFSIQQVAKILGKNPNLIQEQRSNVRLHYLQPVTFLETVVKGLESKFCRVCKKISCFVHFPSSTRAVLEDPFSGVKIKGDDKSKGVLQKVDPKGWKNEWRKWRFSIWSHGTWMLAHRCDDPSFCSLGRTDTIRYDPSQTEKWIAKALLQKGVTNPCLLAEFAEITCRQAASLFAALNSSQFPLPQKYDTFTAANPTFPYGDNTQYAHLELPLEAECDGCSCVSCTTDLCPCLEHKPKARKLCEKYCECIETCSRRFLGCNCKYGRCDTNTCVCVANQRECDPDLCLSCCSDLRIPRDVEKLGISRKAKWSWVLCTNTVIQSLRHKRTAIAQSAITGAGYGLFTLENLKENEFITEYTGEMISDAESVRRGIIYDSQEHSYIFSLNQEHCIDAIVMGNKMRFANHRSGGEDNCFARNMRVMGNICVALYAKRDIEAGSELFFDYQYQKGEVKYSWFVKYNKELDERKKGKKKAKSVGNS